MYLLSFESELDTGRNEVRHSIVNRAAESKHYVQVLKSDKNNDLEKRCGGCNVWHSSCPRELRNLKHSLPSTFQDALGSFGTPATAPKILGLLPMERTVYGVVTAQYGSCFMRKFPTKKLDGRPHKTLEG
ncbi:hypothetical protein CHS0354_028873 [Potamilus streckersoni]|uniref:Uncharacterized protein n=1 Tax=Potamilus streckersoni TaxID=2493646 RepID=A0AAE0RQU5_9BIVA|nr:hypothetical protein CHS0354_028873 [Potamilus streckersoni]